MNRIYELLEGKTKKSKIINVAIAILILLNITAVILDSYKDICSRFSNQLYVFEVISIIIFTIEYILRLISAPCKYSNKYNGKYIIRYVFSPLAVIDLLSILPFYLPLLITMDLRFLRIIRVFRLIRILKIKRYSKSLDIVVRVLKKKKTDLVLTLVIIGIMILMSGSIMFYIENEFQPELFPNIVDSSMWSLKTMIFLGYDNPPITTFGKIIGMLTTLLGLGWIALPISIISSGFIEEIHDQKNRTQIKCPYCKKEIDL
jgi:voltage-gated potassium channel